MLRHFLAIRAARSLLLCVGTAGLWLPTFFVVGGENKHGSRTDSFLGSRAGDAREVGSIKLCWCPPGRFRMGSPPDEPERRPDEAQVEVALTKGFWMGKYEVTQGQWKQVVRKLPGELTAAGGEGDDLPVYNVNYPEAEAFCLKLTQLGRQSGDLPTGWEFRLPTEAQWEYACRAGTKTATSFGDTVRDLLSFGADAWLNGQFHRERHLATRFGKDTKQNQSSGKQFSQSIFVVLDQGSCKGITVDSRCPSISGSATTSRWWTGPGLDHSAQAEQHPLQIILLCTSLADVPSTAILLQFALADNAFSLARLNHLLLMYDWRQQHNLP